ncbi:hypothetical protein L6164_004216 [Bauhinia variegata]|uniref:Uncharacterized protein n=1 Tax=Bauhinia variegata TaxID=167791 RepID=A0ACB9Q6F5_BAUVA|nr:hypothetical protein L6164_004216 [Bauhinia variegata]
MGRSPCCSKEGLNRGAWTATEDKILTEYIKIHGEGKWRHLPKKAGLKRCGKSCRLRWLNYLRPDIKRGNITDDEQELIIRLHNLLGNRWSLIAGRLPGRTDNEIKNYWNTNIGKKIQNGNPISSTLPNSSQHKTNLKTQKQNPNPPNMGSCVFRTKATRCTKVILTQEPQRLGAPLMAEPFKAMTHDNSHDYKMEDGAGARSDMSPSTPPFETEGQNPLDFMVDFEMDQTFFSDLFKMDFPEPSRFENNIQDNNNVSVSDKSQASPKSNDVVDTPTPLLSEDSLHGTGGFQSMATLGDHEFDWL